MVDFAPVADPQHVLPSVVSAFGLQPNASLPMIDILGQHIQNEDALIVLDNCEHVLEAAAEVTSAILRKSARARILVTTQIPLGLTHEHIFKLQPFAAVSAQSGTETSPSVSFFRHCYEALGEELDDRELPVVERLCESLSGVALALKMAAARSATLGVDEVARQIQSELNSLVAPWPSALPRHRSLSAALTWSYGLLTDRERQVFRALGIFVGGFSMEAAVAVGGEREIIFGLVQKSLIVRETGNRSRYRLLETARHFALDQLQHEREDDEASTRHAAYVRQQLEESMEQWDVTPDRNGLPTTPGA